MIIGNSFGEQMNVYSEDEARDIIVKLYAFLGDPNFGDHMLNVFRPDDPSGKVWTVLHYDILDGHAWLYYPNENALDVPLKKFFQEYVVNNPTPRVACANCGKVHDPFSPDVKKCIGSVSRDVHWLCNNSQCVTEFGLRELGYGQ